MSTAPNTQRMAVSEKLKQGFRREEETELPFTESFYVCGLREEDTRVCGGTASLCWAPSNHVYILFPPVKFHGGAIFSRHVYLQLSICTAIFVSSLLHFKSCLLNQDLFLIMCMCLRVYAHMSTGACRSQKRAAEALELKFQVVVSCLVDARNEAQVPCQSSAYSLPSLRSP